MAWTIKVKGENDSMEVENNVGQKLVSLWQDYHRNKKDGNIPIQIEQYGWHGLISDIRSIKFIKDAVSQKPNNDFADYVRDHTQIRNMTPEQKSNRIGYAKVLHYSLTGRKLEEESADFLGKLKHLQLKYFIANPSHIHPNPIIFKELYPTDDVISRTGFDVIGRVTMRDNAQVAYCA